jgi:hypothetical protein
MSYLRCVLFCRIVSAGDRRELTVSNFERENVMKNKMNETNVWNELSNLCLFPVKVCVTVINILRNKLPNVKIGRGGGAR